MTYNLTGWPAFVVRGGVALNGHPVGLQIHGAQPWREDVSLAMAGYLEKAPGGFRPAAIWGLGLDGHWSGFGWR